jgi:hypothetical protein
MERSRLKTRNGQQPVEDARHPVALNQGLRCKQRAVAGRRTTAGSFPFTNPFAVSSLPLDRGLVDDHLGSDVGQFASLLGLDLLSHGFEISLHPVDADRNTVDERERLRVLCQDGCEHTCNNVSEL